jgi:hypothetical protein
VLTREERARSLGPLPDLTESRLLRMLVVRRTLAILRNLSVAPNGSHAMSINAPLVMILGKLCRAVDADIRAECLDILATLASVLDLSGMSVCVFVCCGMLCRATRCLRALAWFALACVLFSRAEWVAHRRWSP